MEPAITGQSMAEQLGVWLSNKVLLSERKVKNVNNLSRITTSMIL